MKITEQKNEALAEIHVQVCYPQENSQTRRLLALLHALDYQLPCTGEYRQQRVNAADIFYIESVDKKTFVYLEQQVLRTEGRIYQLKEQLGRCIDCCHTQRICNDFVVITGQFIKDRIRFITVEQSLGYYALPGAWEQSGTRCIWPFILPLWDLEKLPDFSLRAPFQRFCRG